MSIPQRKTGATGDFISAQPAFKNLSVFLLFFIFIIFFCAGTPKTEPRNHDVIKENVVETLQQPEVIARTESEIAEMIENLLGKSPDKWKSELPTEYGLDVRYNLNMKIIQYCEKKQCILEDYSLFLVYTKVTLKQCIKIPAQPLVNPVNNEFIGCEPIAQNRTKSR
jgi:hypothetical protein